MSIVYPITILGGLGLLFGVGLSLASKVFSIERDPRIDEVRKALPGANCGACGYPGCDGLASAIVAGEAPVNACSVGGAPVAEVVADIMGGLMWQRVQDMLQLYFAKGGIVTRLKKNISMMEFKIVEPRIY